MLFSTLRVTVDLRYDLATLLRALNDRLVTSFRLGKYASVVGVVSVELTLN